MGFATNVLICRLRHFFLSIPLKKIKTNAMNAIPLKTKKMKASASLSSWLRCRKFSDKYWRTNSISDPPSGNNAQKNSGLLYFFHQYTPTKKSPINIISLIYTINLLSNNLLRYRSFYQVAAPVDHSSARRSPELALRSGSICTRIVILYSIVSLLHTSSKRLRYTRRIRIRPIQEIPYPSFMFLVLVIKFITSSTNSQSVIKPFLPTRQVIMRWLQIIRILRRRIQHMLVRSRILQCACLKIIPINLISKIERRNQPNSSTYQPRYPLRCCDNSVWHCSYCKVTFRIFIYDRIVSRIRVRMQELRIGQYCFLLKSGYRPNFCWIPNR